MNLDDLYQRDREVERRREDVFLTILARAHSKIKTTARRRYGDRFCFYLVPEFLIGVPLYKSADCMAYIIAKLRENGFIVKYTHPNLLFISWQHYLDRTYRMEYKKRYGQSIDGFGNIITKPTDSKQPEEVLTIKKLKNKGSVGREYKAVSSYKPTGNFIYGQGLLRAIEDKTRK